jgi:hypothetical protein
LGRGGFDLFQGTVLQFHGKTEENNFRPEDDTFFETLSNIFSLSQCHHTELKQFFSLVLLKYNIFLYEVALMLNYHAMKMC